MRLIIAGSRAFTDYSVLIDNIKKYGIHDMDVTVLSGGARGADKLGERFANEYNKKLELYPAQWDRFGRSAGYQRNVQMADNATHLLAFWDGTSPGTRHMINIAKQRGLNVAIVDIS
jgi:hypothetical protein